MEADDPVRRTVADGETPTSVVVAVVASVNDSTPGEVSALDESVDPGALDGLFDPTRRGPRRGRVEFEHDGCALSVSYEGEVTVTGTPLE